jgi:hypothetical protein
MVPETAAPGCVAATTSAKVSPNSAATFARSSSVHGEAPVIRRCACEYDSPIASASHADWRYFGSPWRSIRARTHATASDEGAFSLTSGLGAPATVIGFSPTFQSCRKSLGSSQTMPQETET